ncbi:MAG: hypothetical protein WDO73_11285 [Ignavibacteriota bacterium]
MWWPEVSRLAILLLDYPDPAAWCNTFSRLDPIALGILMSSWLQCRKPLYSPWLSAAFCVVTVATFVIASHQVPSTGSNGVTPWLAIRPWPWRAR